MHAHLCNVNKKKNCSNQQHALSMRPKSCIAFVIAKNNSKRKKVFFDVIQFVKFDGRKSIERINVFCHLFVCSCDLLLVYIIIGMHGIINAYKADRFSCISLDRVVVLK